MRKRNWLLIILGLSLIGAFFFLFVKQEPTTSENEARIREMIVLEEKETIKEAVVEEVVQALSSVDAELIHLVYHNELTILLTDYEFEELPNFHVYKNDLEKYAGFFVPADNTIYIKINAAHSDNGYIALHEFGHATDYRLGDSYGYLSESLRDEFEEIKDNEKDNVLPERKGTEELSGLQVSEYYAQIKEYFAEIFALYYHSNRTNEKLQEAGAKSYALIESLPYRVLTVSSYTQQGYMLTWRPLESATYQLYQNNRLIETVGKNRTEYTFPLETTNSSYFQDYQVSFKAFDSSGKELFTSTTTDTRDAPLDISNLKKLVQQTEELLEKGVANSHFIAYDLKKAHEEIDSVQKNERTFRQAEILGTEKQLEKFLMDYQVEGVD